MDAPQQTNDCRRTLDASKSVSRAVALRVWLCLLLCAASLSPNRAQAQTAKAPLDALILVQPQANKTILSVTFPGAVSHKAARERIARLARAGGWGLELLNVKDEDLKSSALFGKAKRLGKQTGALAVLTNAPQIRENAFLIQPYIDACSDLKRIELLYLLPPDPAFQGLREYTDEALSVRLLRDGGPYRYSVEIKNASGALPRLPLKQPPVSAPANANPAPATSAPPPKALGVLLAPVVAAAAAAGLLVLIALTLRARGRAAVQARPVEPRRPTGA